MNGSSTTAATASYPAQTSRLRSGSKSSPLPPAPSMAREGSGSSAVLNAAFMNGWRPGGTPSPSAGLGITSPTASYLQARSSPIGPPPREALPSLPDSAYEDAPEQGTSSNGYTTRFPASGGQAMAASRPGTMLWDGQQPPVLPHPFGQAEDGEERFSTARTTISRRVMGSSPPQAGAYTRTSMLPNQNARPPSQYQLHDTLPGLPQRSAVPINRQPRQPGISSTPPSAHSSPKLGSSTSSSSAGPAGRESKASTETTSTLQPSASIRERTRSAGTSASTSTAAAAATSNGAESLPSKSVLTIALQKAQTAVELDQQGSEEAAVAAYIHSVRLLKEVMTRVEESATAWRQREVEKLQVLSARKHERRRVRQEASGSSGNSGPNYQSEDDETSEERREREKREAKLEKREKMRLDESRRLRVIHDTYEERIRVLNADLAERARIEQLSAEAAASEAAGQRSSAVRTSAYYATPSRPSTSSERSEGGGIAGIGEAMLNATPLSPAAGARPAAAATAVNISPRPGSSSSRYRISAVPFPESPTHSRKRSEDLIAQLGLGTSGGPPPTIPLPEFIPSAQQQQHTTFGSIPNFRSTEIPLKSEKRKSRTKTPSLSYIAGEERSVLSFSPDSDSSTGQAVFEGQQQQQQQGQLPASYKSHRKNLSSVSSGGRSRHSASSSVAGQPAGTAGQDAEEDDNDTEELFRDARTSTEEEEAFDGPPSELATPTPESAFVGDGVFGTTNGSRASGSTVASSSRSAQDVAAARSRAGSHASSSATGHTSLRHMTSNESLSSVGSSAFAHITNMPVPPLPPQQQQQQQASQSNPRASLLTRQTRSASLAANTVHQGSGSNHRATSSAGKNSLLVNPSTSQGTISQRRKSPQVPESAIMESTSSAEGDRRRAASPEATGAFNASGSLPMRLRALSQPGSKRPTLQTYNSEFAAVPSVPPLPVAPSMLRADSDPTAQREQAPPLTPASVASSGSKPSPPSVVVPTSATSSSAETQHASYIEPETPMSSSFLSITPAPSTAAFSASGGGVTGSISGGVTFLAPSANEFHPPPLDPTRRPYHFLRQLRASIQSGAYLTPRLYIPKQLWQQGSVKLIHIETKVRMMDLLLNGLEGIERLGDGLLADSTIKAGNKSSRIDAANRLSRELESFEGMLDGIQSTLSKKLGYIEAPGGKKSGQSSFGAWSSKLSRSMDRMTKGKNLDAPETYVAAIARLCLHVQILDRHVSSLHSSLSPAAAAAANGGTSTSSSSSAMAKNPSSTSTLHPKASSEQSAGYADLSPEMQRHLDNKLRRTTEFFEKIVCRMILVDLGIWLEKYSKRAAGWTTD